MSNSGSDSIDFSLKGIALLVISHNDNVDFSFLDVMSLVIMFFNNKSCLIAIFTFLSLKIYVK